ncbi:MAG: gamma carbonic anhydrase family protein [Chloroflexi bacterium]|nr:MAG: gamma carbonic anhydrase family protein [Chloroflexota bacterium]HDN79969.1 gamma carbonic anhydrase family protein [Chloroflexota bacterium]
MKIDVVFHPEKIDPSAFIAPGAIIIGDVTVGPESSIWFGTVIRGDIAPVIVGRGSNIQDGAVVHVDIDQPTVIGDGVTIGHGAIVHGCTIGDNVLIGIRAVVLSRAVIGENCIIGAGAVIPEGTVIPPNSVVLGVPGRVVKEVTPEVRERIRSYAEHYREYARIYRGNGK